MLISVFVRFICVARITVCLAATERSEAKEQLPEEPSFAVSRHERFFLTPPYQWADWTSWAQHQCSRSCNGGTIQRHKQCVVTETKAPSADINCVRTFFGQYPTEWRQCNTHSCPAQHWSEWNTWSACSHSCGRGIQSRTRSCVDPLHAGRHCTGDSIQNTGCSHTCNSSPSWSAWLTWSHCSGSCGAGVQIRTRTCNSLDPQQQCPGDVTQKQTCNHQNSCPADGHWSDWTTWSICSHTCGTGINSRTRSCDNPKPSNGGKQCQGHNAQTLRCQGQACPIDGHWSDWTTWSSCSHTCGDGVNSRTRSCDNPKPSNGGIQCYGNSVQTHWCLVQDCTSIGWSQWGTWSHCSGSCGTGIHIRFRTCSQPNTPMCQGESMQRSVCLHLHMCPVAGTASTVRPTTLSSKLSTVSTMSSTVTNLAIISSTLPTISKMPSSPPVTTVSTSFASSTPKMTSTPPMTTVSTISASTTQSSCVDHSVCMDPDTRPVACTDTYIAATYCPKMCGLCGTPTGSTAVKCKDKAGAKCQEALYRMFACNDKDLSHLCERTCNICH